MVVDDLPKKVQAFRVSHHPHRDPQHHKKGKAQELATAHMNSAGVNSVLTIKQYLSALQTVADKVFVGLVRMATGTDAGCLTPVEQIRLRRTSMELMLVKVLTPYSIIHGRRY